MPAGAAVLPVASTGMETNNLPAFAGRPCTALKALLSPAVLFYAPCLA